MQDALDWQVDDRERFEAMGLAMDHMGICVSLLRLDGSPLYFNRAFLALHDHSVLRSANADFDALVASGDLSHWNTDPAEHFGTLLDRLRNNNGVSRTQLEIGDRIIAVEDRLIEDRFILSVQQDITEEILAARKIAYLASHDMLTGLANRATAEMQIGQLAKLKLERGGRFALLVADLDLFKGINDSHGHAAGDAVLREMASRFRSVLGRNDFAARLGGDEFLFLCDDDLAPETSGAKLAERLIACTQNPIAFEGQPLYVGVSLGYALFPEHGTEITHLVRAADNALYRAKSRGRGQSLRFDDPPTLERRL
ncbi:diguanylate cyclase [Agrobacterium vitis]|uniref:GGDEF domain-containing protein n=1 Tax=Agrobacterium vitis TaxID=373 RepID=UPI0008723FF2|nr:GGDEF domain-containing protein [Agrobacterium vitis]MCE6074672.1 diguanylate cyclase [Agrobacterium vitis]MCF1451336.1 GGDEF domain-containing protein [Agrobacterium vitis]MCF1467240.1 GGDEF domain-containing protein [Agrobacterium vitis]MCM2470054.1 GGDEF domain-containing protein [Agrobacterium vitis]MUO72967.1 diguanylate cyclase [Agrobacterium vitis]